MGLMGDTRGQSTVIGATLVFALIILGIGTTQAFIVPEQNAAVAQNHWDNAQNDMEELRGTMSTVAREQSSAKVPIRLGKRLPDRPLLVEGTPPSGTIETSEVEITIRGSGWTPPSGLDNDGDGVSDSTDGDGVVQPNEIFNGTATKDISYTQSGGDWETLSYWIGPVSRFVRQDGTTGREVVESGGQINILAIDGELSAGGISTESVTVQGIDRTCASITGDSSTEIEINRPSSSAPGRSIDWGSSETKKVCLIVVSIDDSAAPGFPKLNPASSTPPGNGTLFNPDQPLVLNNAVATSNSNAEFEFQNTVSTSASIDEIRVSAYIPGASSGGATNKLPNGGEIVEIDGSPTNDYSDDKFNDIPSDEVDIDPDIAFNPGQTRTFTVKFTGLGSSKVDLDVVVIKIDFAADSKGVARYFVQIEK